jgi:hypothetical protein
MGCSAAHCIPSARRTNFVSTLGPVEDFNLVWRQEMTFSELRLWCGCSFAQPARRPAAAGRGQQPLRRRSPPLPIRRLRHLGIERIAQDELDPVSLLARLNTGLLRIDQHFTT